MCSEKWRQYETPGCSELFSTNATATRKAKAPFAIWVHPFLTGPLAVKPLQEARAKVGDDYKRR